MSELRKDPVTGRWVIISTERRKRPGDFRLESVEIAPDDSCPFCEGHEGMTPGELLAWRGNGSPANGPGWTLRVIPNQFPVLRVEGTLDRQGEGLFDKMNGIGAHEVVIESPRHGDTLATLDAGAVEQVLWACRERVQDLKRDRRFRYMIIFKNHGAAAGASLDHSHTQLIALPIVPREARDEVDGARAHYQAKERCVFCDILRQEQADRRRLIAENADMVAVAPYAPRFPFETWILPRRHQALVEEAPRHDLAALARLLGDVLRRMNTALRLPPYNLLIHSAPVVEPVGDYYHWHVEIIPTLTKVAGFEWATGFYLNPVAPEEAAQVLRDARV
ncbi:MAG: galactose-1-phosphate uridylyltransferase [Acidobacteria bacterium RIFCSPLOWO2_02_FULL_68_18]|nr:MAG: galactose-1-phosphate uridylyltransferase [Acidobacteria bacterium RIFCSPLOWO2_02_FULL_68_18]OFW50026.1 MAG: galactose-1-phosphate uridylyltransferase [Acidobacteria bacterium RIFCSPLOWO2_12_FULL_68_19]